MAAPAEFTFRGAGKTITTANQTVTWTGSEIQGPGVVSYVLVIDPLSSTDACYFGAGGIESIRLKAGANPIIDLNYKQFNAYTNRYSHSNLAPFMDPAAAPATSALFATLEVPLYYLDARRYDQAYQCGFPVGLEPQLEVTQGGTAPNDVGGFTVYIGYWMSRQIPTVSPAITRSALGFTAGNPRQQFDLTQGGAFRGMTLPTRGVERATIRLGGVDVFDSDGPNTNAEGDMIFASQMYANGIVNPVYGDHMCLNLDTGEPLTGGRDWVTFDTGTDYQIASPDDEIAIYTINPQGV